MAGLLLRLMLLCRAHAFWSSAVIDSTLSFAICTASLNRSAQEVRQHRPCLLVTSQAPWDTRKLKFDGLTKVCQKVCKDSEHQCSILVKAGRPVNSSNTHPVVNSRNVGPNGNWIQLKSVPYFMLCASARSVHRKPHSEIDRLASAEG